MDPSGPDTLPILLLKAAGVFAALGLFVAVIRSLRRRSAPEVTNATIAKLSPPERSFSWENAAGIVFIILAVFAAFWCQDRYFRGNILAAIALLLFFLIVVPVVVTLLYLRLAGDRTLVRINRQFHRGESAEAIVELQALLDREGGRDEPPSPAEDPWAPPRVGAPRDRRLAERLYMMAFFLMKRGDFEAAVGYLRRADQVGGSMPLARAHLGVTLVRLGRAHEGLPILAEGFDQIPEDDIVNRTDVLIQLARTWADQGRRDEAVTALDQADDLIRRSEYNRLTCRRFAEEIRSIRDRLPARAGLDARGDRD